MKKPTDVEQVRAQAAAKETAKKPSVWGDDVDAETAVAPETADTKIQLSRQDRAVSEPLYDLEGLMTDFPTAKELEKFLYDKTGISLDLKGRSNKYKYQTALDILNGAEPDPVLLNPENPYLDKNDLVPIDPMKVLPPRPQEVVDSWMVTQFHTRTFPHPDAEWKAQGQKCDVVFRKYVNNVITYEILGPISTRPVGVRINKFGKEVPEKFEWVDPRTGEQVIRTENGMITPIGSRLKNAMQRQKVNKTNIWETWIDREFIITNGSSSTLDNPWGNE
jgi:hypothetical protein